MSGLFIDGPCPCLTSPLYDYSIIEYDHQPETASDFINSYWQYPCEGDRVDRMLSWGDCHVVAKLKAFTIADVFKLIECNAGNHYAEPTHRILDFDEKEGIFRQIRDCKLISKEDIRKVDDDEKALMLEAMKANLAKALKGLNA